MSPATAGAAAPKVRRPFEHKEYDMGIEVYETPTFWAEPAGEIVLGRKNENDADKEKWFEGDRDI